MKLIKLTLIITILISLIGCRKKVGTFEIYGVLYDTVGSNVVANARLSFCTEIGPGDNRSDKILGYAYTAVDWTYSFVYDGFSEYNNTVRVGATVDTGNGTKDFFLFGGQGLAANSTINQDFRMVN